MRFVIQKIHQAYNMLLESNDFVEIYVCGLASGNETIRKIRVD